MHIVCSDSKSDTILEHPSVRLTHHKMVNLVLIREYISSIQISWRQWKPRIMWPWTHLSSAYICIIMKKVNPYSGIILIRFVYWGRSKLLSQTITCHFYTTHIDDGCISNIKSEKGCFGNKNIFIKIIANPHCNH